MGRIILASASPRRKALLIQMGINDFDVTPPEVDESVCGGMPAQEAAARLAQIKARDVARKSQAADTIIAADTVVSCGDKVLGKPEGKARAFEMLKTLSGRWHTVHTGLCVINGGREYLDVSATRVLMRLLSDREINGYIETGEPLDKAGAYGIQGRGCVLVKRVDGDYYNVVGLPVALLYVKLKEFGLL